MIAEIVQSKQSLGSVCKTGSGGTPLKIHKEYYEGGTVPWLLSGEVGKRNITEATNFITEAGLENSSAKLFPANSVLIAMYGATAGEVGILRFEAATNQAVCAIYPSQNFVPEFLYYFFLNEKEHLISQAVGNAQPNISQAKIKESQIPVLSLPEQERIVAKLDAAFAAIDQAKANVEQNLQNAKELFQSKLNEVFSQKGDGWVEKRLIEVCELKSGTTVHKSLEKEEGEIAYLKVGDMNCVGNEFEITTSSRFLNQEDVNDKHVFPIGTTIFPKRGGAIATNKKRLTTIPICADLNTMGAVPKSGMDSNYLNFYFHSFDLLDIANGTTILQINNYSLDPLKISVPRNNDQQKVIAQKLEAFRSSCEELQTHYTQKLMELEELKKSLLERAFRGEI